MWKCATVYWDIQKCTVVIWTTAVDWSSNMGNDVITNYIIPPQQCHHTCTLVNLLLLSASISARRTTALCIWLISTSWSPTCATLVASLIATDKTEIRTPHCMIICLASRLANSTSSTTTIQGLLKYWNEGKDSRSFRIVHYIMGVRWWGVSTKRGSTVVSLSVHQTISQWNFVIGGTMVWMEHVTRCVHYM